METYEGKRKSKNGIKRLVFSVLSILLQVVFLVLIFTRLNEYASIIDWTTRVLAILLVLFIYSQNQTATMKVPWIILILAFPVLGVALYLLVGLNGGTKKMKRRYKEVDERLFKYLGDGVRNPDGRGISGYISKYSGYPVYENTEVKYFDEAVRGLDSQLHDLALAKDFIFMEYHAIEDGKAWQKIQTILEERVRAGVEVRVFYDDMGSIGFVNMSFARKLEAVGIKCRVFNPLMPGLNMFLNNRDHRKITVIDGKIGYTGGYNLANEYFNFTHPYGEWKDTGIRLCGQAVRSLTVSFLEMWNASSRKNQDEEENLEFYLRDREYPGNCAGYIQPYADSPLDGEQVGEEVYISMVNKAESYCYFMTPYLIITDELAHALSLAAKRGVDVRIVTPGIPDKKPIYRVTRSFYNVLAKNGVRIFEWTPGFCHAKMSVADDRLATCGTINLDYRSLYHHFENGCFMTDAPAVLSIREDFDETFRQCREVTEKYSVRWSAPHRLSQMIMRLFAQLL